MIIATYLLHDKLSIHRRDMSRNLSKTNISELSNFFAVSYLWPKDKVITGLKSNEESGLSSTEATRRQQLYGNNSIPDRSRSTTWQSFIAIRSRDLLTIFLFIALLIAIVIREVPDSIMIAAVLVLDIGFSYVQSARAERILQRLKEHVPQFVLALRGGSLLEIPASNLVIGDIIELTPGDRVPADARIILSRGIKVNESSLTGESDDSSKTSTALESRTPLANRRNMIYMGTMVTTGTGRAIVTATGTRTEFGKIALVLKNSASPISPWQRQLERVGRTSAIVIAIVGAMLIAGSIWTGNTWALSARTAMTLIISAIPEDLTMILTLVLTVGMLRLLRQQGLVRELRSAETLGETSIICTDKTGTLTLGEMTATAWHSSSGNILLSSQQTRQPVEDLAMLALCLASDAHRQKPDEPAYIGSATERAALAFAEKFGFLQEKIKRQWPQLDSIAFNSRWKYRASLNSHPTQPTQTIFVIGAPEVLLQHSSHKLDHAHTAIALQSSDRAVIETQIHQLGSQGLRLLAVAVKRHLNQTTLTHQDINNLTFLGMLTLADPVRPDARAAVAEAQAAGLQLKLVTGDHASTAVNVAQALNIKQSGHALSDLEMQSMNDDELRAACKEVGVFTRITPLNKQRLVRALQQQGHVVAMTGDGINDAVALKGADIGIAMGSGRDIAKEAADLVLLDNSFATIITAIREGRIIRDNIRKVTAFLLATNAAEVAIFIVSMVMGLPLPLLPAQVLWINLVTDGTTDIALALEPAERSVMRQKPEPMGINVMARQLLRHVPWPGFVITVVASFLYWQLWQNHVSLPYMRTMLFCFIALASLGSAFTFRSLDESILKRGLFQNPWLLLATAFSVLLQLGAVYLPFMRSIFDTVPLNKNDWALLVPLAILAVILSDIRKLWLQPLRSK